MINIVEDQLINTIRLLENHGLNYWIESGTLLGLYRNGELISHDKDIDIGVWSDDEGCLCDLAVSLSSSYSVRKYFYNKRLYKIKLVPINQPELRKIDFNLYFKYNNMACAYQSVFFKKENLFLYYGMLLIEYAFTARFIRRSTVLFFGKWPLKYLRQPAFWLIRAEHFTIRDDLYYRGKKIKIPSSTPVYLENKYGDWRKEKTQWNFMTDDECLSRDFPRSLLDKT